MSDDLSDIYGEGLPTLPRPTPADQHAVPSLARVRALEARLSRQEEAMRRLAAEVEALRSGSARRAASSRSAQRPPMTVPNPDDAI